MHFLVVNDRGAFFWKPTRQREKPVEIESEDDHYKIVQWYRDGLIQLSDKRRDTTTASRTSARNSSASTHSSRCPTRS